MTPGHCPPSTKVNDPDLAKYRPLGALYIKSDTYFLKIYDIFIWCNHKVVIMPRAGEGRSIRIDPEVYEALLTLKRGNMTFSDVIAQMLHETYGWSDDLSGHQSDLGDFTGTNVR
jgi:hypothetical protein